MTLAFLLSMPGRNSWNGRWSGEGRCYAIVRRVSDKRGPALIGYHSYNFGDGWGASVEVRRVDAAEARRLRRQSAGFCGYDWMVTSIINHGAIYGPTQPKPLAAATV